MDMSVKEEEEEEEEEEVESVGMKGVAEAVDIKAWSL